MQVDQHFGSLNTADPSADLEANEDHADQSEGVRCARCQCPSAQQETLLPTENHINSAAKKPCEGELCGRLESEVDGEEEEEDKEREHWGKKLRAPPSAAVSRCPPVDCHHPCFLYRVASGDCPRCLCLPPKPAERL